jgi:hypothetical protein
MKVAPSSGRDAAGIVDCNERARASGLRVPLPARFEALGGIKAASMSRETLMLGVRPGTPPSNQAGLFRGARVSSSQSYRKGAPYNQDLWTLRLRTTGQLRLSPAVPPGKYTPYSLRAA